jgi:predicted DNA binding CopG/RHH family protein
MAPKVRLDPFERSIEAEIDRFVSVVGPRRKKVDAALETARKTKTINIRINELDLAGLKQTAQEEGMPYQTLISSVLHRYLAGRLVDEKHIRKSVQLLTRGKGA